ncbi:MAG: DNA methylase [Candidatus Wallbacteria bacterium HGW-Wallbacteria-1]|jgi:DNA modification methylase|uniref:Methyltransferase n=1 Tax=Candidatus Wallbacteria bacterium HGW-Wallbacteria-1 TaxID=2013854 RepID=A0A2N1PKD4_9BACT|nr:MAG: DNA methylase [Candidatus Wallbacteria bacterium HGW-Wallbacteria-1]
MKTHINLSNIRETQLPEALKDDDVRYAEELVRRFLNEYTREGDTVLDPFAGFGTTLVVAESMNRIPYGVEYDSERGEFIRSRIHHKDNLIIGSSLEIDSFSFPEMDFCFTSPPYMARNHRENPFSAYREEGNYSDYLNDVERIYSRIKGLMKRGAYLGIEVSNLKNGNEVTTLAWDIANRVSRVLRFEGEIIVCWKTEDPDKYAYGNGYDHSYVMMFKKTE